MRTVAWWSFPRILALLIACAAAAAAGASAARADCRLALVLALDVSASVDTHEHRLQREGLASALVDRDVVRLLLADPPVAVYVFEWASPAIQQPLAGWLLVEGEADIASLAAALLSKPRAGDRSGQRTTAVGAALTHARSALATAPACATQTIDVSGDGRNNAGLEPRHVYRTLPFETVTVNALVVSGATPGEVDPDGDKGLNGWFLSNVVRGSGAFSIEADGYEDFERAMKAKLLRELRTPEMSGWSGGTGPG